MQELTTDPFTLVAAALIAIVSTSRITRLLTYDSMPIFFGLRNLWDKATGNSSWNLLMHCQYCASVWVAPAVVLSGYFSNLHIIWWLFNGSLAAGYLGAILMAKDGEE